MEWWKMLTKNRRNSSTLGQVPRCLRVSKPFPTALLALARHCSQGVADSHSTLAATWRWKTEALRGEEIPKAPRAVAGSWSPGLYCYPVLLSLWHAGPQVPSSLHSSPPLLARCSLSWNALPNTPSWWLFPSILSQCPVFFWGRFHSYHNLIYTMHMSVDLFIV